jgi:serine/threonine protein kinase/Tol biopolymer transport system component
MPLTPSTRLGPYEILAPVGAGGMGEVYRARDTRLDRTVAIKILPEHLASRPQLRERFEREARAISTLNHPHICMLHDVGHQDGVDFLVLEYLEGETLAKRLSKGPLPLDQVLHCAIDIADALEQAHRQGVIHRDLKPGNIMLTKTGVKLLDFGLAKLHDTAKTAVAASMATQTTPLTSEGTMLGTLQYMAPEQLEGKEADARTDMFAFGAVLYEMATGQKAFAGRSQASLIAAILEHDPPPISMQQPLSPATLDHLVKTCLAKDPDARRQTMHDVLLDLRWIAESGSQASLPATKRRSRREIWSWSLTAALAVAIAILGIVRWRERPAEAFPFRLDINAPRNTTLDWPVVSPNGRYVAFLATVAGGRPALWLRRLDSYEARVLPGTEGAARFAFWSPDSRSLAFSADGKLKRIEISGGPPQVLADTADFRGGTWNSDGVIIFQPKPTGPLQRVAASGGEARPLELDRPRQETGQFLPSFLPDGNHFLYTSNTADPAKSGLYVGSLDSKAAHFVSDAAGLAAYSAPGFLLLRRGSTLVAHHFDIRNFELRGEDSTPITAVDRFSASANGVLVYQAVAANPVQLAWYGRDGKRLTPIGEAGSYRQITLSPDGNRITVEKISPDTGETNLWMLELSSSILSRLTSVGSLDAVWSPDGREILFDAVNRGHADLYRQAIGAGDAELIYSSVEDKYSESWLDDGSIIFIEGTTFYRLPLTGERRRQVLFRSAVSADEPHVSPDGLWIAYDSNDSGRWEVYVAAFPTFTERRQISVAGGGQPLWRKDVRELFYLSLDGKLMALDVKSGATLETGSPRVLFQTPVHVAPHLDQYCVTADGRRFIVAESLPGDTPISVVVNWPALLQR